MVAITTGIKNQKNRFDGVWYHKTALFANGLTEDIVKELKRRADIELSAFPKTTMSSLAAKVMGVRPLPGEI